MPSPPRPLSPPPPPPPSPPKSNSMPMLYYGLVVVGTAAIVLAIYNLIIIRWCADHNLRPQPRRGTAATANPRPRPLGVEQSNQSLENQLNVNLISRSFKYKKEGSSAKDQGNIELYECAVCLSMFEEGEEVRQLPRCKHSFHAPCIDMWLYSHLDCPLCRSPVEPPVLCPSPVAPPVPNRYVNNPRQAARGGYRGGLLDPSIFGL